MIQPAANTVRERLIAMVRSAGYDVLTACEKADEVIKEFKESEKETETYHIRGGGTIKLTRAKSG